MPTKKPGGRKAAPARGAGAVRAGRDDVAPSDAADAAQTCKVHLLDVGPDEYGDAVLCQFGDKTVLIDGAHPGDDRGKDGHPSIPDQIGELLGQQPPYRVSLIIVSHAHQDHIGCLPALVKNDLIRADWALVVDPRLGWGRAEGEDRDSAITDERVRILAAALREEIRSDKTDDETLERFLADAVTLEDRYKTMLETLDSRGTKIVRYGRDSTTALRSAFADVGLRIIGPTRPHMLECAELINQLSHDAISRASDAFRLDAGASAVDAYRRIAEAGADALDVSRPGPAVNLQSIVTRFLYRGHKFLFAGDMQFEKPEVNNDFLEQGVRQLRQKIKQEAPYNLVKISHHASHNAFSENILLELGETALYGVCAGKFSKHHPSASVLKVLNKYREEITWARTDRNGLVTITFKDGGVVEVEPTAGELNNPQPNSVDVPVVGGGALPPLGAPGEVLAGTPMTHAGETAAGETVEVTTRIPHVATRVTITVDVQPGGGDDTTRPRIPPAPQPQTVTPTDALRIAGGRQLPELLFVTSRQTLAANIGRAECARLLDSIRAHRLPLYDELPSGIADARAAAELVAARLRRHPNAKGVVLIGGYDVVPAYAQDCLSQPLRQRVAGSDDPDNFIVWNDDLYGARNGQLELPVSRIPDGKSAQLVFAAIQAARRTVGVPRAGVRNVARPFADRVYGALPGSGNMHVSKPVTFDQNSPPLDFKSERLYFMLHGDFVDSSRFWGEGTANHREAVNVGNIPAEYDGVVFTGCCWGALTVDTPAGLTVPGRPFGQKTPGSSIALSFLARGATAFIGCTGAHYSPLEAPYNYFGGPMHEAFWRRYNAGATPAQALLGAKREYAGGIPHGRTGASAQAIENKILRQYTCLGLGW